MNITGGYAADLLKQKNIVKLSTGEEMQIIHQDGVLSNGRALGVKYIRPGDMAKKLNHCR